MSCSPLAGAFNRLMRTPEIFLFRINSQFVHGDLLHQVKLGFSYTDHDVQFKISGVIVRINDTAVFLATLICLKLLHSNLLHL